MAKGMAKEIVEGGQLNANKRGRRRRPSERSGEQRDGGNLKKEASRSNGVEDTPAAEFEAHIF